MNKKKRGIYEKIINMFLDILIVVFGIFLLISIYNNVQIKILGNEYSSFFGYSTFEVQTGSMSDTIDPGDWIIVKITKDVKLDDIITYSEKGEFITHRIVETYKDSYITKGDANNSKDDAISKSQVVGKVVKILPGFGIIRKTFFNPFVLITLILTLYSISYVLRSTKNINKDTATNKNKSNYKEKIDALVNLALERLLDYIKDKMKKNDEIKKENQTIENNLNLEEDLLNQNNEEIYNANDLQIQIPEINQEDMDKTLYFRRISVDKTEIDNIELKNKKKKNDNEELEIDENIEKVEQNEIEEKIKLIQNKRKKFKNIVEKTIYFKKEEINKIIDILLLEEKLQTNESTIKESLLNTYIDGKYYNFCGNTNVEFNKKTVLSRIEQEIQNAGEDLILNYKGSDHKYTEKVNKYINIFMLINRLDQINTSTLELKEKRELYKNKILKILKPDNQNASELKDMVNKIIKTQKLYQYMINYILEKINTNAFNLELIKIAGYKNMFAVSLEHNISFSKVYSEYIVDKTYSEGIIAEDKVMVLLNLLLTNIVRDMFDLEENKKYFINIPNSIYVKPNKLDKIFKMFEDEYAKNNIIVVIEQDTLIEYSEQITELRKKGYHFALILNDETKSNDNKYIELTEYIFIDKKIMSYNLIFSLSSDLTKTIINDDIVSKLNSFGGE